MEERQEGGDQWPPQSGIQNECALTYMNASSGQNLSGALMADKNVTRTTVEPRGAVDGVTKMVRLRRTNVTCIWGVSDPSGQAWGDDGGSQVGVAHAPLASVGGGGGADSATGGTERRPLLCTQASHRQLHRRLTCLAIILTRPRIGRVNIMPPTENAAPASAFPLYFFAFVDSAVSRGEKAGIRSSINGPFPAAFARRLNRLTFLFGLLRRRF